MSLFQKDVNQVSHNRIWTGQLKEACFTEAHVWEAVWCTESAMLDTWFCPQAQISITAFLWKSYSKYEKKHEDKTRYKFIYSTQGWIFVMIWAGYCKPETIWWLSAMIHLLSRDYKQKRPLALLLLLASARINWWACPLTERKETLKEKDLQNRLSAFPHWIFLPGVLGAKIPLWAFLCAVLLCHCKRWQHTHGSDWKSGADTKAWFCLLRTPCQSVKPQALPPLPPWCWCCSLHGWCLCPVWR